MADPHPPFFNPRRGELVAQLNGRTRRLRLSLAALAYLEHLCGAADILSLTRHFAENGMTDGEVEAVLQAGLYGAGEIPPERLIVDGGEARARQLAVDLLERAFKSVPDSLAAWALAQGIPPDQVWHLCPAEVLALLPKDAMQGPHAKSASLFTSVLASPFSRAELEKLMQNFPDTSPTDLSQPQSDSPSHETERVI